ncbi:MAG: hypothetical protein KF725_13760 [Cyclobacteriaceae bacterium]|nr:hypothetical protein [Cyclobacteriaceae bacterium]UYN85314.1 MAG: hypothetical protein KIT51_10450 [Cyclobacteriaceae bacterium]
MKALLRNSLTNFFILIFLNAALFEDHQPDFVLQSTYQPVSLAEFLLEALKKRDIPAGNQEELDEFSPIVKRSERSRVSFSPSGSIHADWPANAFSLLKTTFRHSGYQQVTYFGACTTFSEVLRILHLRKLF